MCLVLVFCSGVLLWRADTWVRSLPDFLCIRNLLVVHWCAVCRSGFSSLSPGDCGLECGFVFLFVVFADSVTGGVPFFAGHDLIFSGVSS